MFSSSDNDFSSGDRMRGRENPTRKRFKGKLFCEGGPLWLLHLAWGGRKLQLFYCWLIWLVYWKSSYWSFFVDRFSLKSAYQKIVFYQKIVSSVRPCAPTEKIHLVRSITAYLLNRTFRCGPTLIKYLLVYDCVPNTWNSRSIWTINDRINHISFTNYEILLSSLRHEEILSW